MVDRFVFMAQENIHAQFAESNVSHAISLLSGNKTLNAGIAFLLPRRCLGARKPESSLFSKNGQVVS